MEGFLLVREDQKGLLSTKTKWARRWVCLIKSVLTIFEDFDQARDVELAKLRSYPVDGCEVVEDPQSAGKDEPLMVELRHPKRPSVFLRAEDDNNRIKWVAALNNAAPGEPPGYRASPGAAPAAGYSSVTFTVSVLKTPQGLGLRLYERKLPGMTSVGLVAHPQPSLELDGPSNPPGMVIQENDVVLGVGQDSCESWPLSHFVARVGDFRVPKGSSIKLTMKRLTKQPEADDGEATANPAASTSRLNAPPQAQPHGRPSLSHAKTTTTPSSEAGARAPPPLPQPHAASDLALGRDHAVLKQRYEALEKEHAALQASHRNAMEELQRLKSAAAQTQALLAMNLQAVLAVGATTPAPSDLLTTALTSNLTVHSNLLANTPLPLSPDMEQALAASGLGEAEASPANAAGGGRKQCLRTALAATMYVDGRRTTTLSRWAAAGCGAVDRLARLEARLRAAGIELGGVGGLEDWEKGLK